MRVSQRMRKNRNCLQETGSTADRESPKIGLMKERFQSGSSEGLESGEGGCAGADAPEISHSRESDGSHGLRLFERLILCGLSSKIRRARALFSPGIHGLIGIVLAAVGLVIGVPSALAQASEAAPIRLTVVIFADHRMEDREWAALFDALRRNLAEGAAETQVIATNPEIIRGDTMQPGLQLDSPVVIFLHGDCNLAPIPVRTAYGVPLGWVEQVDGRIEPFVHVDCRRIGQVIGPQAVGINADRRNAMMAGAMARVIAHEWIHIATQSTAHAARGIERAQFGVADLMAGREKPGAPVRYPR